MDIWVDSFEDIVHRPPHHVHRRRIAQRCAALHLQFDLPRMVGLVTGRTQGNEVVRRIPASLAAFKVVNVQNHVPALAVAMLAGVTITGENILPDIPEAHLVALLVVHSANVGVLEFRRIELRHFHHDFRDGEDFVQLGDDAQMPFNLAPD